VTTGKNHLSPQQRIRKIAIQRLESYRRAGITHWPQADDSTNPVGMGAVSEEAAVEEAAVEEAAVEEAAVERMTAGGGAEEMAAKKDPAAILKIIEQEVRGCERCAELAAGRTNTVFGDGNPQARLCFLGEAPGRDEDSQGIPFVGRAGKLLNDIIQACTLQREDVYILNVIKCRPPENRNPAPEEAENCSGFLQRQLETIKPEYICCLGTVAAQNLLDTKETIGRLRGQFHEYQGIKVLATYHPAYLLRNPSAKRQVWDDMQMLMRDMGISIPK
jgi:uracil-DNA glycosylase family 4